MKSSSDFVSINFSSFSMVRKFEPQHLTKLLKFVMNRILLDPVVSDPNQED